MKIGKITALVLVLTLLAFVVLVGCNSTAPEEDITNNCVPTEQAKAAQPVSGVNLAAVKGIAAVADENGFSIIDEKTGKETQIDNEPARSVAFDGNTAYYVRTGIADESVKIRYDDDTMVDPDSKAVWLRGEIYRYNSESGKSERLFTTNEEHASLVYFDSENLYYTDYSDENTGYYVGSSKVIAPVLFKYNLASGKRTYVSQYTCKAEVYDGYIFYNAYDGNSSRHPNFVYPGPVHIYDTKSGKDVNLDDQSEFLFAENGKFYYVRFITEKDIVTGGEIRKCNADGNQLETVKELSGEIWSRYGEYLVLIENDEDYVAYNTRTDKKFNVDRTWLWLEGNGCFAAIENDGNGEKLYRIDDSGEKDLYADLNGIEVGGRDSLTIVERTYSGLYVLEEDDAESVGNIKFIPTGA